MKKTVCVRVVFLTGLLMTCIINIEKWRGIEQKLLDKPEPVYAREEWDFFVVDSKENFYIEDNEKYLIQKFDKQGNFIKGYFMARPIIGIKLENDVVHLLTKDTKEYALYDNRIQYVRQSSEEEASWYAYEATEKYENYYIFHNKITKITDSGKSKEIVLKAPKLPFPNRWIYYLILIAIVIEILIQYIIKKKNKNEKVYEADFEYLWKGNPDSSLQLSVKRVIEIIWGLPGIFMLLLGIFSILSGEMTLAFGLISIGIPFCWLGIGNLILIQYMKKRSEYYLTKKEVVVIKHYKKDLIFKIPFENIKQIYCFSKTKTTITLKLAEEDLIERLAHKGEEDVLYDLRMEDAEKIIELIKQYAGHEIKRGGYNIK